MNKVETITTSKKKKKKRGNETKTNNNITVCLHDELSGIALPSALPSAQPLEAEETGF